LASYKIVISSNHFYLAYQTQVFYTMKLLAKSNWRYLHWFLCNLISFYLRTSYKNILKRNRVLYETCDSKSVHTKVIFKLQTSQPNKSKHIYAPSLNFTGKSGIELSTSLKSTSILLLPRKMKITYLKHTLHQEFAGMQN